MANNRNMQFPGQGQAPNFMMGNQGVPQFVQPGMQAYPMMQQQRMMMSQAPMMQQQGMYPMNMGMRMPTGAPPSYAQSMTQQRQGRLSGPNAGKTEEQLRKEKQFQMQQQKLKQFGKSSPSSSLDPNKLIDSFGGLSDKPRAKKTQLQHSQQPVTATSSFESHKDNDDDGFGDFLGSSSSLPGPSITQSQPATLTDEMLSSRPVTSQIPPQGIGNIPAAGSSAGSSQSVPEKKDLTSMMLECSDLTAPQKAKLFHKPTLRELHPTTQPSSQHLHHDSQAARKWNNSQELSELFIQEAIKDEQTMPKKPAPVTKKATSPTTRHPPKPPPWLLDETCHPELYKQVLEASLVDGQINTERLYPILLLSGLPKELLGQIWAMCNKSTPGQLIAVELYCVLALVALAQNNYQITSPDILSRCPHPPLPRLVQQGTPPVPPGNSQMAPPASGPQMAPPIPNQQIAPPQYSSQSVISQTMASHPGISSPATLPVTQLPPATSQGITGSVQEEDDFADFQAAPALAPAPVPTSSPNSFGDLMKDVKNQQRSPVKDTSKYLYSVPTPDDEAIAATMSPEMKHSTVENFFGSDDSSEIPELHDKHRHKGGMSPNSLDDDYFDDYKSADSKPSDSTSQFSTDQSENEDFKNFDTYLDEFNRKKQNQEKESPLHRPISKHLPQVVPLEPVSLPVIPAPNIGVSNIGKEVVKSDESDFADFQSAPAVTNVEPSGCQAPAMSSSLGVTSGQLKHVSSDLMLGEEDKYAALRSLDFSNVPDTSGDLLGSTEVVASKPPDEDDENWADFEAATVDTDQVSTETSETRSHTVVQPVGVKCGTEKDRILEHFKETEKADNDWADFAGPSESQGENDGWSAFTKPESIQMTGIGCETLSAVESISTVAPPVAKTSSGEETHLQPESTLDDWASFQANSEFSDFQSSEIVEHNQKPKSDLVNVKRQDLVKNEILGLFKVKSESPTIIKSRDDDEEFGAFEKSRKTEKSLQDSSKQSEKEQVSKPVSIEKLPGGRMRSLSSEGDEDLFRAPPPMEDMVPEDEEEYSYSRGYDFDDMMQPKPPAEKDRKNLYGFYGMNPSFVVSSSKKDEKEKEKPVVAKELEKTPSPDDDNDSLSSKDSFGGKFVLDIKGDDSQSVSSLDLPSKGRVQELKDLEGGDTQSVSSNEFGTFENHLNKETLPESKSVDSLDLRNVDGSEESIGSQENSDRETKEDSPDMFSAGQGQTLSSINQGSSLPIVGDRYSHILHDVPGSDKHAYEWQRCLSNCCRMVQDANNIFNSVSSSAVCNEIIKSSQGSEYIQGIIEIYRVVCRITVSMKAAGIHGDKLPQLLKDIDLAWNNLTAFLVGKSIMPDSKSLNFSHGVLMSEDSHGQYQACGVCLLDVDMKDRGTDQSEDNAKLTYGGRQYHTVCANFWINCVDSMLPSLKLPELL